MIKLSLDVNNAYRITERLSFPRLVGSEGELKAREIIVEEFKKAGYSEIKREKFKTSLFNWVIVRYIFIPLGLLLLLLPITFAYNFWLTLIIIAILVFGAIKALGALNSSDIVLSKNEKYNFETENIFTELKSEKPMVTVVFMAHYDTKSQTFPSAFRIAIFIISLLGSLIVLIIYLILEIIAILSFFSVLTPIDFSLLNTILLYICIFLALVGSLNFFNKTGNKSPGAYDNAASVGTTIELARYFKINSPKNVNFIFLCTSSEELNLGGAKHFIKEHGNEFDKNSTFFINFDGIGGTGLIRLITSYGIPRTTSSKKLNDLFLKAAKELKIATKSVYLPTGAWSDYMPIVKSGFEACWLCSQGGLKYVHTSKDNLSLVSKEGLKNGLQLCIKVVEYLNKDYSKF
ncbi:MAG: M28 family metallopeptidase [Promethearchaeota archaeon]